MKKILANIITIMVGMDVLYDISKKYNFSEEFYKMNGRRPFWGTALTSSMSDIILFIPSMINKGLLKLLTPLNENKIK